MTNHKSSHQAQKPPTKGAFYMNYLSLQEVTPYFNFTFPQT